MDLFSVERVARALGTPVVAVELVEPLQASANQVARLDVRFPDVPGIPSAGLGPHDVAYCMTPVPADDRVARDLAMLRRYWAQLRAHGVTDYSWDLCHWDHRLSLIHNAFQSLFQGSHDWLRHSLATIELHDARAVLRAPPPG